MIHFRSQVLFAFCLVNEDVVQIVQTGNLAVTLLSILCGSGHFYHHEKGDSDKSRLFPKHLINGLCYSFKMTLRVRRC